VKYTEFCHRLISDNRIVFIHKEIDILNTLINSEDHVQKRRGRASWTNNISMVILYYESSRNINSYNDMRFELIKEQFEISKTKLIDNSFYFKGPIVPNLIFVNLTFFIAGIFGALIFVIFSGNFQHMKS